MADARMARGGRSDDQIDSVLNSIRRLLSQDDAGYVMGADRDPDGFGSVSAFAAQRQAQDATEMRAASQNAASDEDFRQLRDVIEHELGGQIRDEVRLVLGADTQHSEQPESDDAVPQDMTADAGATLSKTGMSPSAPNSTPPLAEAISPIIPHSRTAIPLPSVPMTPRASMGAIDPIQQIQANQENEIMLAEMNRSDIKRAARAYQSDEGDDFDLFATSVDDDDDQVAGGSALRNLVRDVIRQELQGEMGGRISRNLRRAIRQEVAAAISAGLKTS